MYGKVYELLKASVCLAATFHWLILPYNAQNINRLISDWKKGHYFV